MKLMIRKKLNIIEKYKTKLNDEYEESKEVNKKEENVTTYYGGAPRAEIYDKHNEICEGEKLNDERVGEDVSSVEKADLRSNTGSLYENDDSFSGFDASICWGDNFYDTFENKE